MGLGSNKIKSENVNAPGRRNWRRRWFSFRKSQDGAAAVEFALVSIPFFLILFSILEQGFFFLGNRLIDAGVNQISREIKTRQLTALAEIAGIECVVTDQSTDLQQFKKELLWNNAAYGLKSLS